MRCPTPGPADGFVESPAVGVQRIDIGRAMDAQSADFVHASFDLLETVRDAVVRGAVELISSTQKGKRGLD